MSVFLFFLGCKNVGDIPSATLTWQEGYLDCVSSTEEIRYAGSCLNRKDLISNL